MSYPQVALESLKSLLAGQGTNPESKIAFERAEADLHAFIERHQFYGEAAIMMAALTLAQDPKQGTPE